MKAWMARKSLLVPTVEFFASDLAMGNLLHKVLEINVIYLRMIGSCQLIFEIGCHFGCSIFFNDRHQVYGRVNCSSPFHLSISATHSTTSNPSEIPLAEYVTRMAIDIPQLVLYSWVPNDLEGWMAKREAVFAQVEEEAAKATPELFVE